MQRVLIVVGILALLAGLAWPWLSRLGLGNLPGDLRIERDDFVFYFPITSSIVVSLVLSVIIWLFRK